MKANLSIVPTSYRGGPLDLVYLGISGVLHPSESAYWRAVGRSPWEDGHVKYEGAPRLLRALSQWPDAKVVLTSTLPWRHRLHTVLKELTPALAARVLSYTYEDLTKRAQVITAAPDGRSSHRPITDGMFWRMSRAEVVSMHVRWMRPRAWVVVDDDDSGWLDVVVHERLVLTDSRIGLAGDAVERRLQTILESNFGGTHG